MRIAIVGSHSTGKTTLLRHLAERLEIAALSEVAREMIAESDKLPHHMTGEERGEFQMGILREQMRRELAVESFLSDRSVFDAVAYSFDTPSYGELLSVAKSHGESRPYDRIFFLPIEFPLEGDAIRSQDEDYRLAVENELWRILTETGTPFVRITGDPEARLAACLESFGN
ncbi:MAG: ATP-binding protein [Patescibacteria group bacterium]